MPRFLPALRGLTVVENKQLYVPDVEPQLHVPSPQYQSKGLDYAGVRRILESTEFAGSGGSYGVSNRADNWDAAATSDAYERAVWTFKSVEYIAGHQARLPFRIGKDLDSDNRQVLAQHPLYRVLNKRANPLEIGRVFRKRLSAQVLLSPKGAFVEVVKSRAGNIVRLDLLAPDRVRIIRDTSDDYIDYYEFTHRNGHVREIPVERIRWIREPHPFDPFAGVSPMQATAMSMELDWLSRYYNVSFIRNDSRPGGVVGVDVDGLEDAELERIERRFEPGAQHAGKISVIGTGPGGMTYIDTTTRPRDMAYSEGAANAKNEILSGFGLSESLFGNSGGRTLGDVEQDQYNAWSETLVPHFELIAGAFDEDVDPEYDPFVDTSSVEVLELPRRKRREEARQEYNLGLRSVNEYRPLAGMDEVDSAYARALWISPSKAPIATRPDDEKALGLGGAEGAPAAAGGAPAAGQGAAAQAVADAQAPDPASPAAQAVADAQQPDLPAGGAGAAQAVTDATVPQQVDPGVAADAVTAAREGKSFTTDELLELAMTDRTAFDTAIADFEVKATSPATSPPPAAPRQVTYEPSDGDTARLETSVAAALDAMLARQIGVLQARLDSPKARKGTRFWEPESAEDTRTGDRPIDVSKVVDEERWADETASTMQPLTEAAAVTSAAGLFAALAAGGALAGPTPAADDVPSDTFAELARDVTTTAVKQAVALAVAGMRAFLRDVATRLDVEQLVAPDVAALTQDLAQLYAHAAHPFATSLAEQVAQAAVHGGAAAAAASLTPMLSADDGAPTAAMTHTWLSQRDNDVRPTHRSADGQTSPVGTLFRVGGALLRFPADPLGPPEEVRNCRCRATYRAVSGAQLLLPPTPARTSGAVH